MEERFIDDGGRERLILFVVFRNSFLKMLVEV